MNANILSRFGIRPAWLFPALLAVVPGIPPAAAENQPNFVWIISEDNSKHFLRLFDEHGAPTPNIEALAEQGVVFDRAFSNAPVCSVARSTLISSCYAPRIGAQYHRRSERVPMPDGLKMFPAYLRAAGYYTTNRSKEDYNITKTPDVWDDSSKKAHWRNRAPGQPFFHKASYAQSHEGQLHVTAKEMAGRKTTTDPERVFIPPIHPNTPTFRYSYALYHDKMMEIDRIVGQVVDELERDGLLESTFVFYFGDHGGVLPGSKGYAFETGLHVPLVVRIPENFRRLCALKPGARTGGFVSFVDFGPTLLHLAGLPVPEGVDGAPFLGPDIGAEALAARDETFGYADRFDEKYDFVRTLRKGRYTYRRRYQPFIIDGLHNFYRYRMLAYREWRALYRKGELNRAQAAFFEPRPPESLFDIENDPYETNDLAGDPAYAGILAGLRDRLNRRVRSMPDLSFYPDPVLIEHAFDNPVAFGRKRADAIGVLADLADLELLPFDKAEAGIRRALESEHPWERYWGLIVCSSHGEDAVEPFAGIARKLAAEDPERLVRVRAAEFLGLTGAGDPRPAILEALRNSASAAEATLILNTAALLHDRPPFLEFELGPDDVPYRDENIRERIAYLSGGADGPGGAREKRKRKN